MADGNGEVSFEVQSAYLEGRADLAQQVMELVGKAQHHSYVKGMVLNELRALCVGHMQYEPNRWDQA